MNQLAEFIREIKNLLPTVEIRLDELMSLHTTFKIGGPADVFIMPATIEECMTIVKVVNRYNLPLTVIGNGSNLLVRDKGIRGVVLHLGENMANISCEGNIVVAQAGAQLSDVARFAGSHSLSGLEFAVGIPGSLGGGVFMNAGAYDGELKNVVMSVKSIDKFGRVHVYEGEALEFGYRHSIFQENLELIIEATMRLTEANQASIDEKMRDLTHRRESKQPLEMPSAGSTFKRPVGYFAGTLIDQAGLKGLSVGGAQVSLKHAGFVVNTGSATAQDVIDLISEVQTRVYEHHGVNIHPEVKIIGE